MEHSPYAPMQPSYEGPNPLRPYYRPPSIGVAADPTATSSANRTSSTTSYMPDIDYRDILGTSDKNGPSVFESLKALTDQMAWKYSSVFLAQPFEVAKMVLQVRHAADDSGITSKPRRKRRHGSAGSASGGAGSSHRRSGPNPSRHAAPAMTPGPPSGSESEEEMSYFTSTVPEHRQPDPRHSIPSSSRGSGSDSIPRSRRHPSRSPLPHTSKFVLRRPDSLIEVISQLWTREGAWGIWKGTNATFLHNLLLRTLETWLRGMLCAVANLPDPAPGVVAGGGVIGGLDILDSPSPMASLGVAVLSAGISGLLLVPLDIVRTRIILTPTHSPSRSILPLLRRLPHWACPGSILTPSLLHTTLPTLISTSTPLLLRNNLNIDPIISPAAYSVATFLSSAVELFVKLPIETVLRRAQVSYLIVAEASKAPPASASASAAPTARSQSRKSRASKHRQQHAPSSYSECSDPSEPEEEDDTHPNLQPSNSGLDLIVTPGPYVGILGTVWHISQNEGTRHTYTSPSSSSAASGSAGPKNYRARKGQGVQGLWRGWRVGLWALVGVWGTRGLGRLGGGRGSEF